MKKVLLAAVGLVALAVVPAAAADLPPRAPVLKAPPPVEVWTWTGLYIGGNVGYSWGRSETVDEFFNPGTGAIIGTPLSSKFDLNGWVAGGQAGYNWQSGNWVFGIEADIQWTGQDGDTIFTCAPGGLCLPAAAGPGSVTRTTFEQSLDWFGTVRARLGMTVTPTVLAYVTGGLAYGHVETEYVISGFNAGGAAVAQAFSVGKTRAGWTAGGGIEARLWGNWTGKVEYLYIDLGSVSGSAVCTLCGPPNIGMRFDSEITDHIARAGLNYKFGGRY